MKELQHQEKCFKITEHLKQGILPNSIQYVYFTKHTPLTIRKGKPKRNAMLIPTPQVLDQRYWLNDLIIDVKQINDRAYLTGNFKKHTRSNYRYKNQMRMEVYTTSYKDKIVVHRITREIVEIGGHQYYNTEIGEPIMIVKPIVRNTRNVDLLTKIHKANYTSIYANKENKIYLED